ncbi:NAD(P)-dependent oxidoreductase [Paenibacillus filicis]|uniref:NAD(P)-dependent oxidoreductase n=1 Tax=Paenibacillus gyeongsangnamensis TaxID=3388067 RepID=A0ABT4Q6R8_9BACL|nr:NAD(P)-dependent oxidoreductase [Paenibacillus filicis]MCZ8512562.1 NAD(P)-dependent oxidoreductase [Paenibacillus filicis]
MENYKNKNILITGASGFVGVNLYTYLVEELGCKNVYRISRTLANVNSTSDIECDITDKPKLEKILLNIKPDVIFHLAANINPSRDLADLDAMISTNILGTTNLLSIIGSHNLQIDSLINIGTCEEYGFIDQPFTEDKYSSPISLYSGTKAAVTSLCKMFYNIFHIPVVTVRPSLIYGPGQKDRFFINQAIKNMMSGSDFDMSPGEQTRDFIYIDDLVRGLVEISKKRSLAGEIINISSGKQYKLIDVIDIISKLTKTDSKINIGAIPYRKTEIMSFACDNRKMLQLTEWKPNIPLEDGLKRTMEQINGGVQKWKLQL